MFVTIFIALVAYWTVCIRVGKQKTPPPTSVKDYFIANREIKTQWYILAATATSFSGWTFISHPGMIFSYGFQASLISFYAITIAFTGVLFLKRQWLLGKKFDFITPVDMFSSYFKSAETIENDLNPPSTDGIKIIVIVVAFLFSLLYLAVQLRASGYLIGTLTGYQGERYEKVIMVILTIFLLLYILPRGFRRVAYVDQFQFFLLVLGIIILGGFVFFQIGGWNSLKNGMIALSNYDYHRAPNTEEYSHYFAIPGMIQWDVWNFDTDTDKDGWTGMMLLTFMFALMGIQSSPAFTMWAFSSETPNAFAHQQVWASSFLIGLIMLIFITIQGIGTHFLGANANFSHAHPEIITIDKNIVQPPYSPNTDEKTELENTDKKLESDRLVPNIILSIKKVISQEGFIWVGSFVITFFAIAALAAIQSTAASYIATFGSIAASSMKSKNPIKLSREFSIFMVFAALVFASLFKGQEIALLGGLAVACGLQMWPALVAICWWPFLTRQGIILGIIAGLSIVFLTDNPGNILSKLFSFEWMRYPLTIHSAVWGLLVNFIVAFGVSCLTQNEKETQHRMKYHQFLKQYASVPENKQPWKFPALLLVIIWFTFAIGPGAVIGNDFFGNPNEPHSWWFGLIPIWAWQAMWWMIGVFMMWFLAYYLEMSTMPDEKLKSFEKEILIDVQKKASIRI